MENIEHKIPKPKDVPYINNDINGLIVTDNVEARDKGGAKITAIRVAIAKLIDIIMNVCPVKM